MNEEDSIFSWIKEQVLDLFSPFRQSELIYGSESTDLVSSFGFSSQPNLSVDFTENESFTSFSNSLPQDTTILESIDTNSGIESSPKPIKDSPKPLTQANLKSLFGFKSTATKPSLDTPIQPKKKQKQSSFLNVESTKKIKRHSIFPLINGDMKISVNLKDIISPNNSNTANCELNESNRKKFQAEISDSVNAEAELSRFVSKQDFKRMKVLGQFNLGFIIVRLDNDLFVIDQHARYFNNNNLKSDEKYTFETLMKTIQSVSQNLVNPLPIKFSSSLENRIVEYLPLIQKYGFDIQIKEDGLKSFFLTRVPNLKNLILGLQDLEELIVKLNAGEKDPIPSRIRGWYASKACRTSVMIGTALTNKKMKNVNYYY